MSQSKVCLTFDYEPFLGPDSGSIDSCVLEPTCHIIDILNKYQKKAIFFVDFTFLARLKSSSNHYFHLVIEQIKRIIDSGSQIGLHLHPHWLDSLEINESRWDLSNIDNYRIHRLDRKKIDNLFNDSFELFKVITKNIDANLKLDSFRAGGWCVQPFDTLIEHFECYSIHNDFSVTSGLYRDSLPFHYYDYRSAPHELACWRFDRDPTVVVNQGRFLEIPVTPFSLSRFKLLMNKIQLRNIKIYGNGQAVSHGNTTATLRKIFNDTNIRQLTLDRCGESLFKYSLIATDHLPLKVFASHPKMFCIHSLKNLEYLAKNYVFVDSNDIVDEFIIFK